MALWSATLAARELPEITRNNEITTLGKNLLVLQLLLL